MKIRTDYVSNSSSSSFMLVGQAFDEEELKKAWLTLHPEDQEAIDSEELYSWEIAEKISNELQLDYHRGLENYSGCWAIGLGFGSMMGSETKNEFLERIKERLKPAFGNVNVCALVDGGYNG